MTDAVTQRWIRNRSDELAVDAGCTFDESRGQHVLEFARKYLRLYEGELAGQTLTPMPWQVEVVMRLFGWVKDSERWRRKVRRFRHATIWIPKKNGKSPTLAWLGLYLLCADGELGQKVYFGAKDGSQAREIAGKHALEMVLSSPELSAECDINRTTMQITHLPTRSILKPISSGDTRAQKSKEGLNGSLCIDELHVVDGTFMSRVSRAGISRSEPLMIAVSTAGNDPESYGKQQYDYGKQVESGAIVDEEFFFQSYEAPQTLTAEELAADPVKYGKLANPAWGCTVGEEEYLKDYQRSSVSLMSLADFLMYRLNVWQQSEHPWLNMGDWGKCRQAFAEQDLLSRDCYGGLDLAKTRDTTALALTFPEPDGTYKLLVFFWLPEATAASLTHLVRYQEWSRQGWIVLTKGNTVDYGLIRKQLLEVFAKFRVRRLAYDDCYAEQMVQRLVEEDGIDFDVFRQFDQTITKFASPTATFERLVSSGQLHHNGNPLLTWQAGNTKVKTDTNQNMRPVKQKHGDHRTIDGIVAGIMSVEMAVSEPNLQGEVEFW